MDTRRRTVPRSARNRNHAIESTKPMSAYAPAFDNTAAGAGTNPEEENENAALPPLRTGMEAVSPVTIEPAMCFGSAPQTAVSWIPDLWGSADPGGNRPAVAVAGSGDGGPDMDHLTFYEVQIEKETSSISAGTRRTVPHAGKVNAIRVFDDSIFVCSSDGGIRVMQKQSACDNAVLNEITKLPKNEAVVDVGKIQGGTVAFGADGTLCLIDEQNQLVDQGRAEVAGVRAAVSLGDAFATAGACGDISIWSYDDGINREQTLRMATRGSRAVSITADSTQSRFVMAGLANGELCIWDRRGTTEYPLSRVQLHDGYMWDLSVVDYRGGLLLSAGEDGHVWLMDFGEAASRGAVGSTTDKWREIGEHWRAQITQSDVRNIANSNFNPVNSVATHPVADLYAYATDAATVTFGTLYN